MEKVNRERPCPICGKPDWCLVAKDGTAAICQRTEQGAIKRAGEAGWLHRLGDASRPANRPVVRTVTVTQTAGTEELARLAARWRTNVRLDALQRLATTLGLTRSALNRLGIGWTGECWSFPMTNVNGVVLGIRLRKPDGAKFAVKGGHEGLFIPSPVVIADTGSVPTEPLLICEGPTDAAALLDMGFEQVVGRPSCSGGKRLLVDFVRHRRPVSAVIVADADEAGRRGADALAAVLVGYVTEVRVIEPPVGIKDARAWLISGGNRQEVERVIQGAEPRTLVISTKRIGEKKNVS